MRTPKDDEGDFWPAERPGRRRKSDSGGRPKLLIGAAILVVVLAIGGAAAYFFLFSGDEKEAAADGNGAATQPTIYTPSLPEPETARLNQRTVDPRPLNAGEVFTPETKTVTFKKYTFNLVGSQVTADCAKATWGARLQADLRNYKCSQIIRGAYLSADKAHAGQFMAVNLDSRQGADQIIRDLDRNTGAGFILPLAAPGVTKFGTGFSAAYAQSYGHYAIVTWVQRTGGAQPASLNEMIDASLAVEKPGDFVWARLDLLPDKTG